MKELSGIIVKFFPGVDQAIVYGHHTELSTLKLGETVKITHPETGDWEKVKILRCAIGYGIEAVDPKSKETGMFSVLAVKDMVRRRKRNRK